MAKGFRDSLTIRLHSAYKYHSWDEINRWKDFDPKIEVETGSIPILDLYKNNRLVIHSYDSTGILECLSQNIPMLAFWQDNFDHLREEVKPFYQLLLDAGILHLNPESIAKKINETWDDIDEWWNQEKTQEARIGFVNQFAYISNSPLKKLKDILLNQEK